MTSHQLAGHSGIKLAALDPSVRPANDLFRHVNGKWLDTHEIPADRAADGSFRELHDQAEEHVREIITELGAQAQGGTDVAGQIGGLFASFMDTERIEALGLSPLDADFALVDAASTPSELAHALGVLARTGALGGFNFFVDNDADDPNKYVVYLYQGGLGLPDEAYYRDDKYADIRTAYVAFAAKMLLLGGRASSPEEADAAAARILDLETKIAAHHWDSVRDRDSELTYNPMTFDAAVELAPGFDFTSWLAGVDAPAGSFDDVVLREPSFFTGFAQLWSEHNPQAWRDWFALHLISGRAPYLTDQAVELNFDFYGRTLSGTQEVRERWKRGVSLVEGALGEAVGKVYVERHFPATHKVHMDKLVANLIAAYRKSISELEWMGEETKVKALAKLEAFTPKIGYPAAWKDYSALVIDPTDLVGNVRRSATVETARDLAKVGKPIDRDEWHMTPQTVNAYYNPGMNEIVFPAAILQPPFFDPTAEDAANYGGIGAVIGHEIGHGFDDQGSKYDGAGRLVTWWTEQDRAEFEKRTGALIAQFDALVPAQLAGHEQDYHVNGALTIGENIGDLGGLSIALAAYEIALGTPIADAPVIDDLTGAERMFLSWGQIWNSKMRDEMAIQRLETDPHSPNEFRCNTIVSNIDLFYTTYGVTESDSLFLAPEDRVRIW